MTTLVTFDGTDLVDGDTLIVGDGGTGDTVLSSVAGVPVIDDDDVPYGDSGERAMIVDDNGAASYAGFAFTALAQARARFYFKTPAAWPASAVHSICSFTAANNGRRAGVSLAGSASPGQLRLTANGTTAVTTSPNNTVALNTWYWMEFWMNIVSSSSVLLNCRLYDLDDNLLWSPAEASGNPTGTTAAQFFYGISATTPRLILPLAHLKVTDTIASAIGVWPHEPPPVLGDVMRVVNAGSEEDRVVRMFNGTAEVPIVLN